MEGRPCGTGPSHPNESRGYIMENRKDKGFTLIELLVVVAIIALLLSIIMPALGMAKEQARRLVCRANIRSVMQADQIYATQNDGWHVPVVNGWSPNNWAWYKNPELLKIIALDRDNNKATSGAGFDVKYNDTLPKEMKCPTDKRTAANGLYVNQGIGQVFGMSYGFNIMSIGPEPGNGWYYMMGGVKGGMHALKTTDIRSPGTKFRMMDCSDWVVDRERADYTKFWDVDQDLLGAGHNWHKVAYRHKEGANVGYYDGHVDYQAKEKIYQLAPDGNPKTQKAINSSKWVPKPGQEYLPFPR